MTTLMRSEENIPDTLIVPLLELPAQVVFPRTIVPLPRARLQRTGSGNCSEISKGMFLAVPARTDSANLRGIHRHQPVLESGVGCLMKMDSAASVDGATDVVIARGVSRARYRRIDFQSIVQSPLVSAVELAASCMQAGESRRRQDIAGLRTPVRMRQSLSSNADGLVEMMLLPDDETWLSNVESQWMRQQLIQRLVARCPDLAIREMASLLECELPLGHLCDLAAPAFGLSFVELQQLLNEHRVEARCRALLEMTSKSSRPLTGGIPDFTEN